MIIDNKQSYGSNENIKTVWDCISDYSNPGKGREGKMDIVTGFFSVAALHILYTTLQGEKQYISVSFPIGVKRFIYPDAFEGGFLEWL